MRVYLFDIDGTLLASGGAGRVALGQAMQAAFEIEMRHDVDLHGRTDRWIGQQLLESHGLENSESNWARLRDAYLERLQQTLAERAGRVLPGVVSLLTQLGADSDAAIGLLTGNVRRGAQIKLSHYELDALIDPLGFGGFGDSDHCRNRVAAAALASARERLGSVDPADVWVIGDTPRDVDCARAIGAKAAAVATGGYSVGELAERKPDLLLADLADPAELLK
ncbi:MAG: HAD family hydrolase [Planctomycetales bacterium]|nr:HAD family hydrolase [Planctomycetales bacterium]